MLVVDTRNQRLYKSSPLATSISRVWINSQGVILMPACPAAQIIRPRPVAISGRPISEIRLVESQNWLSIGFNSTKSRVPCCTWPTIVLRLGRSQVLVIPSSRV